MENSGCLSRKVPKKDLIFNTDYSHPGEGHDHFRAFQRSLDAVSATQPAFATCPPSKTTV